MSDILDPRHEALVEHLFRRVCLLLGLPDFELKPMRRRLRGKGAFRSFKYGYTRLNEKSVTIDLYTPKTMTTRRMDSILRVICHELAHHQAPPRTVIFRRRLCRLAHHPEFWQQVKSNVELISKDEVIAEYFKEQKLYHDSMSVRAFRINENKLFRLENG
jgi:predicted SprT family Zn-dependent metalloprotease